MTGSLLLLIVCYALLGLLLLALCFHTRWSFWIKTGAVIVVTGFYFLSYDALTGLLGYPTAAKLPSRFIFHHAVMAEPDKNTGEKGSIHIWVTELTRKGPAAQPRAYFIPWEKDTQKAIGEAQKKAREGIVQLGTTEDRPAEGNSMLGRLLMPSNKVRLRLQDQPSPALPEK